MTPLGSRRALACSLALVVGMISCTDEAPELVAPDAAEGQQARVEARRGGLPSSAAGGGEFVVLARANELPRNLASELEAAGGEIVLSIPEIGAALVRSSDPAFAAAAGGIRGIGSVSASIAARMAATRPLGPTVTDGVRAELSDPPLTDIGDRFFDLQWSMDALDWTEAVEISDVRGAGARVAILDSGIRSTHNEFAANLNTALSTSFVAGEAFDDPPGFHGTHVSGIVAAARNGLGIVGVAPEAELVSVKVLAGVSGGGSFAGIAAGMVYAALIGADVVNMSIGATLDHDGTVYDVACQPVAQVPAPAVAATIDLLKRAARFAHQRGVTLIASAGNCGDDGDKDANRVHLPSDLPHVLSISATGPVGWAVDPGTNLDRLASYSNFGRSVIDFAAPGGDAVLPGNDPCTISTGPLDLPVTVPCWVFDMVMSASHSNSNGYVWTVGTSMAAPAATGVAALIISKNGGSMSPARVGAAMRKAVNFDDGGGEGRNGRTAGFGRGHLSALEALR